MTFESHDVDVDLALILVAWARAKKKKNSELALSRSRHRTWRSVLDAAWRAVRSFRWKRYHKHGLTPPVSYWIFLSHTELLKREELTWVNVTDADLK